MSDLIEKLPTYFTISVASKRNSGKSFLISCLIRDLIRRKRVDMVLVMSGSAGLNSDYSFLPKGLVQPFSEPVLKKLWTLQHDTTHKRHILVVLDDCLSERAAIDSKTVHDIFTLGRHLHISCIVASQVANWLLSPLVKANSDFILWSKLNRQQLDTLWTSTSGISKEDFMSFSGQGGKDFTFCCLDNYRPVEGSELFLVKA